MTTPVVYPLDPSGVNPASLVQNELHTVSGSVFGANMFLIPNFAPFFIDNFKIDYTVNGITRQLVEDVDFSFALSYVTGTRTFGKAMYGGVILHNLSLSGLLSGTYQTLGGDQVADRMAVLTLLADKAYNPRTTIWDILTNVPNALPPVPNHYQDYDEFFGQEQVVSMLGEIRDAIITNSSLTAEQIQSFLGSMNSASLGSFLLKQGGIMLGPLLLNGAPSEPLEAVTKQYVDSTATTRLELASTLSAYLSTAEIDSRLDTKMDVFGDTMTGPLVLNAPPTENMQATNKSYVDERIAMLEAELSELRGEIGSVSGDYISRAEVERLIGEAMLRTTFVS